MALPKSPAIVAVLAVAILAATANADLVVGGRTEVKNVKENAEVQALGRFSVEEYKKREGNGGGIEFSEVVEAEKQVVAGIKYYLKVEAALSGEKRMFDSEVVVVPWERSKQLLKFAPSSSA